MRIVPPAELRSNFHVKLAATLPKWVAGATELGPGIARERALDAIMSAMTGYVTVAPDMAADADGRGMPGRFGVTEPHPFPELIEAGAG